MWVGFDPLKSGRFDVITPIVTVWERLPIMTGRNPIGSGSVMDMVLARGGGCFSRQVIEGVK